MAANQGNIDAQFQLALMYETGEGLLQKNYSESLKWYSLAANQGHDDAITWLRLAANEGNSDAQYYVGYMYENGHGIFQDYVEAAKWYRLAADQGHVEAIDKIRELERKSIPKDTGSQQTNKSNGKEKVSMSYDHIPQDISGKTDPQAQCDIADGYYRGDGVAQDYTEAAKWYRLAADQGSGDAQSNLGNMYRWGYGVSQDYVQALQWYRLAADQGNSHAQYNIGIMYSYALGVKQDYTEAVKWYRLAADQGHSDAKTKLQDLERKSTPEETNSEVLFDIGLKYYNGHGVTKEYNEAVKWFRLAAERGYTTVQSNKEFSDRGNSLET